MKDFDVHTLDIMSLLLPIALLSGVAGGSDPYSLNILRFELKMRTGGRHVISSFSQKQLARMGDGVAIGLIKILGPDGVKNPEIISDLLPVILSGFSESKFILRKEDRKPAVTLLLLNYLKDNVTDRGLVHKIEQAIATIQTLTAA